MRRILLLIWLMLSVNVIMAQETVPVPVVIDSAQILAQNNTSITLSVSGSLGTGCQIDAVVDHHIENDALIIRIYQPVPVDVFCPMVLIPYQDTLTFDLSEPVTQIVVNDIPLLDTPMSAQSAPIETDKVMHLISNAALHRVSDGWLLDIVGFVTDGCTEYDTVIEQTLEENRLLVEIYRAIPKTVQCPDVLIDYEDEILIEYDLTETVIDNQIGQLWFPDPTFVIEVNDYIGTLSPVSTVDHLVLLQTERELMTIDTITASGDVVITGEFDQTCNQPVFTRWTLNDNEFQVWVYRVMARLINTCQPNPEQHEVVIPMGLDEGVYTYTINETFTGTLEVSHMERVLHVVEDVQISVSESTPAQVSITIRGYLSDGCQAATKTAIEETSNGFVVMLYRELPPGVMCPAQIVPFEETLSLGPVQAGDYTLQINNYEITFTVE
ncbi:MAG: hypothetical protein D6711_05175 [Chloroflexi bacterium]|nr:MAG: hypothetical protein D6711_05175 [Chloroflexota bacterium]